jgi:hypothetical protein
MVNIDEALTPGRPEPRTSESEMFLLFPRLPNIHTLSSLLKELPHNGKTEL